MSDRVVKIILEAFPKILIAGIKWTVPLTIISFVIGLIIATIIALIQYKKVYFLDVLCRFYIWILRGTPVLVQLFVVFFGLPSVGIVISPFPSAILVFAINSSAYMSESILGAFKSIDRGQFDAAYSLGLNFVQTIIYIIIPQALRSVYPTLFNEIISLIKDTSLAANITVMEMLMVTKSIVARTYEPLILYIEVGIIYLFFSSVLSFLQRIGEKSIYKW